MRTETNQGINLHASTVRCKLLAHLEPGRVLLEQVRSNTYVPVHMSRRIHNPDTHSHARTHAHKRRTTYERHKPSHRLCVFWHARPNPMPMPQALSRSSICTPIPTSTNDNKGGTSGQHHPSAQEHAHAAHKRIRLVRYPTHNSAVTASITCARNHRGGGAWCGKMSVVARMNAYY